MPSVAASQQCHSEWARGSTLEGQHRTSSTLNIVVEDTAIAIAHGAAPAASAIPRAECCDHKAVYLAGRHLACDREISLAYDR